MTWTAELSTQFISSQSTQFVYVPVTATVPDDVSVDPTGASVSFAFLGPYNSSSQALEATPVVSTTWTPGSWAAGASTPYTAQCLVGPLSGTITLTVGTYVVWIKIFSNPETPILFSGPLVVT